MHQQMDTPFKNDEIKHAVSSLKNNKSPAIDELQPELLKNGPNKLYNNDNNHNKGFKNIIQGFA